MSSFGFYKGIEDLYKGNIDLISDDIRCALLSNSYTPDQAGDEYYSDVSADEVSGGGYSAGGVLLTGKTASSNGSQSVFDADNVSAWESSSFTNARYILIYKDTGVAATSQLIALIDFGGVRNAPLTINWNESGIFGFNSASGHFDVSDFEDAVDPLTDWTYSSNDWTEQVDPSVVPLTSDNFDSISGTWEHYVDCETGASPYGFDSVTDVNGQLAIQNSVYKEGSNALRMTFDGTQTQAFGTTTPAAGRSSDVIAFWINVKDLRIGTDGQGVTILHVISTAALTHAIRVNRVDSDTYTMFLQSYNDASSATNSTLLNFSVGQEEWIHIILIHEYSSAPAADDGVVYAFINGDLVASVTGFDNDTYTTTEIRYGPRFIGASVSGSIYFDEIYDDEIGAPFTVAIKQMQGRDYSMCAPNASYGIFNFSAPASEGWIEADFKNEFIESGGFGGIIRARNSVSGKNFYIQLVSDGRFRLIYDTDTTANNTGSYYDPAGEDVTIAIYWRSSSAPAADDGEIHIFVNGESHERLTGLDTDTITYNQAYYGYIFSSALQLSFYGTMRYTTNDSVISIKDWAAQDGNYGVCGYISPSAATASISKQSLGYGNDVTIEFEWDSSNLVLADGDSFRVISVRNSIGQGVIEINARRSGSDYNLQFNYDNSAGASQSALIYTLPANKKVKVRVTLQSETGSNDGWHFVYIDDEIQIALTDLDMLASPVDSFHINQTTGVDAGTYGTIFWDNVKITDSAVPLDPLGSGLDEPTSTAGDFEDDIVPDLESLYFFIYFLNLLFTAPTIEGKPTTQTPTVSDYKVRLKNQSGEIIAEFDNWLSLNFNHAQNKPSNFRFEIDGRDSRKSLFETDGQLEIWRRNKSVDLDWYIEWEGFIRSPNDLITESDDRRYVSHAISYFNLVKRAYIMWPEDSAQAKKSGVGETVIKEIVAENIGSLALASAGRARDHVFSGVSVEADAGRGLDYDGAFAWTNALTTIQKIASKTGLICDVVGVGDALFEFRVYEGQRGEDRSKTTGSNPLVFSTGYGNMLRPLLSINRGDEFTAVVALGQGTKDDRQQQISLSDAVNDSPWNDIEAVVKNTQATEDAELLDSAKEKLEDGKKIERLSFEVQQTKSAFYGKDYSWGTKITAVYGDYEEDIVFDKVDILINKESSKERIKTELSNKNETEAES